MRYLTSLLNTLRKLRPAARRPKNAPALKDRRNTESIPDAPLRPQSRGEQTTFGQFPSHLDQMIEVVRDKLGEWDDLVIRKQSLYEGMINIAIFYVETLVDKDAISRSLLVPMLDRVYSPADKPGPLTDVFSHLRDLTLGAGNADSTGDLKQVLAELVTGKCILAIDGFSEVLLLDFRKAPGRAISEPKNESIIRGPKEGFNESLQDNIGMIRKRLLSPDLKLKQVQIGRRSKTAVAVLYIAGLTNQGIVDEVFKRLNTIDIDVVLESGYIEQLIEDDWLSPFPQLETTERPDMVVAALLQGKVAILVDNSPFALECPTTLDSLMHSPEDQYERWLIASTVRILRFAATLLALTLPSFYIALTSYHPEMIPTDLALAVGAARQAVPFPAFVEAFGMELALELLREAGIRLPAPIGQTIGIVGGLIIGEAAVRANIVSPAMVIVVATTAIASFAMPNYSAAVSFRLSRFFMMMLTTVLGLYGLVLGMMTLLTHLAALKSFGVSFLSPWAPLDGKDLKDALIRLPLPSLKRRPSFLRPLDIQAMEDDRDESQERTGGRWG